MFCDLGILCLNYWIWIPQHKCNQKANMNGSTRLESGKCLAMIRGISISFKFICSKYYYFSELSQGKNAKIIHSIKAVDKQWWYLTIETCMIDVPSDWTRPMNLSLLILLFGFQHLKLRNMWCMEFNYYSKWWWFHFRVRLRNSGVVMVTIGL